MQSYDMYHIYHLHISDSLSACYMGALPWGKAGGVGSIFFGQNTDKSKRQILTRFSTTLTQLLDMEEK